MIQPFAKRRVQVSQRSKDQLVENLLQIRACHFEEISRATGLDEEHLNFALATPEGTHALRVRMSITRHSLAVRQEVCAMMALNMLRRWLNGKEVASEHGWINVVESLFVE